MTSRIRRRVYSCALAIMMIAIPATSVLAGDSINPHHAGDFGATATDGTRSAARSRKLDGTMADDPVATTIVGFQPRL